MTNRTVARPVSLHVLVAGMLFQGVSGVFGGGALLWDATGDVLNMPLELLVGSPFADYRIPGLLLFVVLGLGPLIVGIGLWQRRAWAWYGAIAAACGLVLWIAVQITMIGYYAEPPLQLVYGCLGLALLALALLPSVRRAVIAR